MRLRLLIYCCLICLPSFAQEILKENLTRKKSIYWDFEQIHIQATGSYYQDELGETIEKHGKWVYFDREGIVEEERNYYRDKLSGKVVLYYPNKKLKQEGYFKNDVQDSVYREWYENGKLLKKKNTFTDFVDCSKFVIAEKYTSPEHLYAEGGSAGGLLMGAIVNMAPELYNGVIAQVPFVDVITTMLDDTIPLTTGEYDEWGNPNEKKYYDYMLSYSPYDQVKAQAYPNMYVSTGLHDSQVQYWEPAKWVAKLRVLKTNDKQLFLDTNMDAGHGGASGRFEALKELAKEFAFLLDLEKIKK